jgi:hypothetical protein
MINSLKNDEKTFFSYKNLCQNEPFVRKTARKNAFTAKMWEKNSLESKNDNNLFSSKFDARSKVIYHILF